MTSPKFNFTFTITDPWSRKIEFTKRGNTYFRRILNVPRLMDASEEYEEISRMIYAYQLLNYLEGREPKPPPKRARKNLEAGVNEQDIVTRWFGPRKKW